MDGYLQKLRELVGSSHIFVPGVRAIILNSQNEILLQFRIDMDLWGIPGGAVELGESALDALKREVREETSLEVAEAKPMALFSGPGQQFAYPNGDQVQGFALAFIIDKWRGIPVADGTESNRLQFFSLSCLPENISPVHKKTIDAFLNDYSGQFFLSG